MTEPTVIRPSVVNSYADCNRRGAARLFQREIEAGGFKLRHMPRSIAALIGVATHWSAKIALDEKALTGKLPPVSMVIDAAVESLTTQLGDGEVVFDGTTGGAYNRDHATTQTLSMVRIYHAQVAPSLHPVIIEQRFEAETALGLIISGMPDLVAAEPEQIVDLKTGLRPRNHNAQIGCYSVLAKSHNIPIKQGRIDFIRRVPPGKPQPAPVTTRVPLAVAEQTAANVIRHISEDLSEFRRSNDPSSFLANPSSVLCSAKYCPAHGTDFCREWQINE